MTASRRTGESNGSASLFHARLTTAFVTRQFLLLTAIGVLFFVVLYFFDYFQFEWDYFWQLGSLDLRYLPPLPLIIVLVFGYTYLIGVLFALVPSERSFQFFFNGILAALFILNYDHSVIDWLVLSIGASVRQANPVSVFKLVASTALFSMVIFMHYNILSDDFTRRMIRRGIPTEEAALIRPGMIKSLVPLLVACVVVAGALGLVGEFSALVFSTHGLLPKIEIVLLGGIGLAIAYVLRSMIRELYQSGGEEDELPEPAPERDEVAEAAAESTND